MMLYDEMMACLDQIFQQLELVLVQLLEKMGKNQTELDIWTTS